MDRFSVPEVSEQRGTIAPRHKIDRPAKEREREREERMRFRGIGRREMQTHDSRELRKVADEVQTSRDLNNKKT